MRAQKRRILVAESVGDKDTLVIAQTRLQRLVQEYKRFSKAAGLRTQQERLEVAGFGPKQASRATGSAKKQISMIESFKETMTESGYTVKGFDYYTGDLETLQQMQTAFTRLAKDFPDEANGLTIHLSKTADPTTYGWFDRDANAIHYSRDLFKDWKKLQDDYKELVNEGHFPVGTDARGCFYHEFGHAVWFARGGKSLRKAVDSTLLKLGHGYVNVEQRKTLIRKLLSGYAAETTYPAYQEVIAEAFSEWYNSDKPREFCKELLKEVGIR